MTPLKWAGNKQKLAERITAVLGDAPLLIEPFAGAAAVTLGSDYPAYWLGDCNPDLINFYRHVQMFGGNFVDYCQSLFADGNQAETYYRRRSLFNSIDTPHDWDRAALFLYLNRHGYNGLCRYNRQGGYNVPFGRYKRPYFPQTELMNLYEKLSRVELFQMDFEELVGYAQPGDVVYFDPPYAPLAPNSFSDYASGGFSLPDQQRLARVARALAARGVRVVVSNHDTPLTRELYRGARIEAFPVKRTISCKSNGRLPVRELLAVFEAKTADTTAIFFSGVSVARKEIEVA